MSWESQNDDDSANSYIQADHRFAPCSRGISENVPGPARLLREVVRPFSFVLANEHHIPAAHDNVDSYTLLSLLPVSH